MALKNHRFAWFRTEQKAVNVIGEQIKVILGDAKKEENGLNEEQKTTARRLLTNALREYIKAAGGSKVLPYGNITEEKNLNGVGVKTLRKRTQKALKIAPFFNPGREAIKLLDKLYSYPDLFDKDKIFKAGEKDSDAYKSPEGRFSGLKNFLGVGKELNEQHAKLKLPNLKSFKELKTSDFKTKEGTETESTINAYNTVIGTANELISASTPARVADSNKERDSKFTALISAIKELGTNITALRALEIETSGKKTEAIGAANAFYSKIKKGYEEYAKSKTNESTTLLSQSGQTNVEQNTQEKKFQGTPIDEVKTFINAFYKVYGSEEIIKKAKKLAE